MSNKKKGKKEKQNNLCIWKKVVFLFSPVSPKETRLDQGIRRLPCGLPSPSEFCRDELPRAFKVFFAPRFFSLKLQLLATL